MSAQSIANWLLGLDPVWLLLTCALLVFLEDAIFIGFVIPGETAAVVAGVGSAFGHVPVEIAIIAVVVAAILGDTVGYEIGKHLFSRVRVKGTLAKHEDAIARGERLLARRGAIAVFLGRFTAFFRAMMPAMAGAARMPYPVFLRWNALGGIVWGTGFVLLGHAAGKSYEAVAHRVGGVLAIAISVLLVAAFVAWRVRKRRLK